MSLGTKYRLALFLLSVSLCLLGFSVFQLSTINSKYSGVQKNSEVTSDATRSAVLGGEVIQDETFRVRRVIDGDTIELATGQKVRYIGIDTPETVHPEKSVECFGKEASEENRRLTEGKLVRLEKDVSETDRYGRLLRYVYVGDVMVNEALVREGFAYASTYPPDVSHQEILVQAQQEAIAAARGLWGGCTVSSIQPIVSPSISSGNQPLSSSSTSCVIKGNVSSGGEKIYHLPGCGSYDKTVIDESMGERWFCSESEAGSAGWRKAKNCP